MPSSILTLGFHPSAFSFSMLGILFIISLSFAFCPFFSYSFHSAYNICYVGKTSYLASVAKNQRSLGIKRFLYKNRDNPFKPLARPINIKEPYWIYIHAIFLYITISIHFRS